MTNYGRIGARYEPESLDASLLGPGRSRRACRCRGGGASTAELLAARLGSAFGCVGRSGLSEVADWRLLWNCDRRAQSAAPAVVCRDFLTSARGFMSPSTDTRQCAERRLDRTTLGAAPMLFYLCALFELVTIAPSSASRVMTPRRNKVCHLATSAALCIHYDAVYIHTRWLMNGAVSFGTVTSADCHSGSDIPD